MKVMIEPLTAIRGFAALLVAAYHIKGRLGTFDIVEYLPIVKYGWLGVDFFFILSGFILAHVYFSHFEEKRFSYLNFMKARAARIYPVHVATLLIWVGLGAWSGWLWSTTRFSIEGFVANLTMVHAWHLLPNNTWNFPAWSISAEWFAYMIFPLLAMLIIKLKWVPAWLWGIMAIAALHLILVFQNILPGRTFNWTYDWAVVRIGIEFSAGLMLYRFRAMFSANAVWSTLAVVATAGLVWVLSVDNFKFFISREFSAVLLTAVAIFGWSLSSGIVNALASWEPLAYFGRISYSLYMWHAAPLFVLTVYLRRSGIVESLTWMQGLLIFMGYILVVCIGGALLYHLVEKPMQKVIRGLDIK